jgi:tRNA-uridine 2-sulfurtransferase
LLKKQGFDVFGAHFRFFDGESAKKSLNKAKIIAKVLEVPLEIVDARKGFRKKIIDYFIESYKKGITPNPCVACNKEMKFHLLFNLMKKYKAKYIATGHYARLGREFPISNFQFSKKYQIQKSKLLITNYKLLQAFDESKDQSYFLYRLTQKELSKIVFSLGEYKKIEVKKMAKKFKLPVFEERESQDICFLVDNDINRFLKKNINPKSGDIIDEAKNILGKHKGLPFYTIGQRKGIEIGGGPYFVTGKNLKKNELLVSSDPKKLLAKKFEVNQVNWINKPQKFPSRAEVQIRYHSGKFPAIIKQEKSRRLVVETVKSVRAVTAGQSAVFYNNSEILGGGTIC